MWPTFYFMNGEWKPFPSLHLRLAKIGESWGFFKASEVFLLLGAFFSLLPIYSTCSKLTTSMWGTLVNQMCGSSSQATRGHLGKHFSFVSFQSLCLASLSRIISRMLEVQLPLVLTIYKPAVCGFIEYLFDQTYTAWLLQTQDWEVSLFLHTKIHFHLFVTYALRDCSQL